MKICTKCNDELPIESFSYRNKAKGTRRAHCRSCHKKWFAEHYKSNSKYYIDKAKLNAPKLRQIAKEKLNSYLADKSCIDCGEKDTIVLEFDHLADKERNIGDMVKNAMNWQRILKEIEKCEIVCANCHRRRTAKRAGWYKGFSTTTGS